MRYKITFNYLDKEAPSHSVEGITYYDVNDGALSITYDDGTEGIFFPGVLSYVEVESYEEGER